MGPKLYVTFLPSFFFNIAGIAAGTAIVDDAAIACSAAAIAVTAAAIAVTAADSGLS